MRERSFWEYCKFVEDLKTDARRTLSKQWIPFYKFQPLDKIRDYFGEKITFYFAWEGTFLTVLWPAAVIGTICFTYGFFNSMVANKTNFGVCITADASGQQISHDCSFSQIAQQIANLCLKAFDNAMNPLFAIFISVWGTMFMQVWNRNRSVLAYQWSVQDYVESEPDRPEFFGTRKEKDPITGNDEWTYPLSRLYLKLILSAIVVLLCMSVAVGSVIAVILYKLFASSHFACNETKNFNLTCIIMVSMLPSLMNTISTMILGTIYSVIANKLTYWENHRTISEYNNALVVKLFAFQFVNNYTSLFYLAFIRPEYYGLQHNGLFGLGVDYKDTCDYGTCGSLLALQVLSHMLIKPIPKFCKDVVVPYFVTLMKTFHWNRRISAINEQRIPRVEEEENNRLLREWMKPNVGDFTLGEFTEKMILLGCIMMFAPLFPLAPLLALVIGLIDIRIDARRLLWFNRRPIAFIATNIGIWNAIVNFIQYFAVITNTFIVAFTSNFCNESVFSSNEGDCTTQTRLLIALIFQNTVFASKFLIASLIPEVPSGIRLAQRRKRYVNSKIMETGIVPQINRKKKRENKTMRTKFRDWVHQKITIVS
uniref:Anoctamin n=2 Tax=Parascaris univalens TaxID=6257 RepID=A0A915B4Y7_PARUN